MAIVGIVGGLGPESTIDYYRRILEASERSDPSTAPSIVIDSLVVQRALHLVESDHTELPLLLSTPVMRVSQRSTPQRCTWPLSSSVYEDLMFRCQIPLDVLNEGDEAARQVRVLRIPHRREVYR